jgi:hypothetical protein
MFDSDFAPRLLRFFVAALFMLEIACHGAIAYGQDDSQPYMVYVDQEEVSARCGPGGEYYRTDPLRHGQALEVYVETADGWLGVRPPDGSFCWLPADVVKLSPSLDFGIVTEEGALAWIGTHLGKANKYLWQVQLSKGEEVAILGRAQREGPDGPKLWFRIVPPAGEFRWVHRDQVVENPEMLLRDKPKPGSELANAKPTLASPQEPRNQEREESLVEQSVLEFSEPMPIPRPPAEHRAETPPRPASLPVRQAAAQPIENAVVGSGLAHRDDESFDNEVARPYEAPLMAFTTRPSVRNIGESPAQPMPAPENLADTFDRRSAPRSVSPASYRTDSQSESYTNGSLASQADQRFLIDSSRVVLQPSVVPVSNTAPVPLSSRGTSTETEGRSVDSLQLELSRLMARSAPSIDVEPVVAAASLQARVAATEIERQRAAMIVQRAQQYQMVAQRRDGHAGTAMSDYPEPIQLPSASSASISSASANASTPMSPGVAEESPAQEAVGYLVQVFSSRPDSPPFALTDSTGRTTYYVSPAPGVNIRRYLNQFITVRGTVGYSTGLDTPHVITTGAVRTAER